MASRDTYKCTFCKAVETICDYCCGPITAQFYVITGAAESRQFRVPSIADDTRPVRRIAWFGGLFELLVMAKITFQKDRIRLRSVLICRDPAVCLSSDRAYTRVLQRSYTFIYLFDLYISVSQPS
jgi:uncharacterized membrane protein